MYLKRWPIASGVRVSVHAVDSALIAELFPTADTVVIL